LLFFVYGKKYAGGIEHLQTRKFFSKETIMADISAFEHEDGELVVDSRLVAEQLGLDHNDWFQNVILEYQTQTEQEFGFLRFENVKTGKRGRPQRVALLTEDQAIFYMTLLSTGQKLANS